MFSCCLRNHVPLFRLSVQTASKRMLVPLSRTRTWSVVAPKMFSSSHKSETGLFSIPGLQRPSDFLQLSSKAMDSCDSIASSLEPVQTVSTRQQASDILFRLDEISRKVCNVIDAAELCRSVHSSQAWRDAASAAFSILSDYISRLNANTSLYHALVSVTDSTVFSELTEEEKRFCDLLKAEFERDGIHLPDRQREELRQMQNQVTQLETRFTENITNFSRTFEVLKDPVLALVPEEALRAHGVAVTPGSDTLHLTTDSTLVNTLARYSPNPSLRKQLYMEGVTTCPENLQVLDDLILSRHQIATMLGFRSYADRFLRDKMAKNQSNVYQFLRNLQNRIDQRGNYKRQLELLSAAKQKVENNSKLQPWDVSFYSNLLKSQTGFDFTQIAAYLTFKKCIESMIVLVDRLFGIQMKEEPMSPEEQWDNEDPNTRMDMRVRKFGFWEESGRFLGTMYLDLHPRQGKYVHSAHFTVRCGCALEASEETVQYQNPVVALVCNLTPQSIAGGDPVITHNEMETLFHEFGHALHSLLSRTKFQHMSGTRGSMDFVETPSHLIENFVWNPAFLSVVGEHYQTGEPIPEDLLRKLLQSRNHFRCLEIQNQVLYSLFDQIIFGEQDENRPSTTDIFAKLHRDCNVPYAEGSHWHSRFGHLVTYGAGYYGYLYSQVFAGDIWKKFFHKKGPDRESGEKVWRKMLIHGGAKDPTAMLHDLLGREPDVGAYFTSLDI